MTLPSSGQISVGQINAEFQLGTNISAYYGVKWYKDDNTRGFFNSAAGNRPPFLLSDFYSKRKTIPVVASGPANQSNGSTFTFPFYHKVTVIVAGGSGGSGGKGGYYSGGYKNDQGTAGGTGGEGGDSFFGAIASAAGGKGGGGGTTKGGAGSAGAAGSITTIIFDAEANTTSINGVVSSGCPLRNTTAAITVGSAGGGGSPGRVLASTDGASTYVDAGPYPGGSGSAGEAGYVSIKVE